MPPPGRKKLPSADFPSPRFDPFRRTDRYGARGCAPQPPLEVFRGAVTALALAPLKLSVTLSAVVVFYLVCRFSPLLFRDEQRRARVVTSLGRRCARLALLGLGFVSVRFEDVGGDELPANYPLTPPIEEEGNGADGGGGGGGGGGGIDGDGDGRRRKGGSSRRSPAAEGASSSSPPSAQLAAGAIVSNHCGWIDILVHMAAPPYRSPPQSPSSRNSSAASASTSTSTSPPPPQLSSPFPSFVARASTEDLPLIGVIAREIGCLFVDRSKQAAGVSGIAASVRDRVSAAAEAGRRRRGRGRRWNSSSSSNPSVLWPPPLLLFPEGTTTNGRYLLRFKTGAFLAGAPVAPVLLSYGPSPGLRFNPSWESIAAGRHALLLIMQPWLTAVVRRLPAYHPSAAERRDPALFAAGVRAAMLAAGGFAPSDSTIADKWEYQALLQGKPPRMPPPLPPQPQAVSGSGSGSLQQQQQQQKQHLTNGGGGGKALRKGGGGGGAPSSSSDVAARASSGDAAATAPAGGGGGHQAAGVDRGIEGGMKNEKKNE